MKSNIVNENLINKKLMDENLMNENLIDVKMWKEQITLPTYEVGSPNKNPLFLEKRVYQGSSGKIYPLPFTDTIANEKVDKTYDVVFMENDYILIMIMPEMGGKIYRALDKTNHYDFVYYNQVVKPALVGLTGPWVSGGIEFNWPQHHRPSTFSPVNYELVENSDGSKTCWISEIDRMYGTQGMAGFTLYKNKSYIEIKGQLFNRTEVPQTFLWWANPAVSVNDYTQSIFPPDVHAVFDHGKRDVSKFPIASGIYYKMDYSEGVDISRYKNIPVPTSYMAYHSDYNFVGGYDFSKEAGILHYANHHISPGKKQWTWGNGDFGQAWDRNLTDEDGPYIELMTGAYTDNQPDFSWLAPKEVKNFKQYFLPYKGLGEVKNASLEVAINLIEEADGFIIKVYSPAINTNLKVFLYEKDAIIFEEVISYIDPRTSFEASVNVAMKKEAHAYKLQICNEQGKKILSYQSEEPKIVETPEPAKAPGLPHEVMTNEELFLIGLHLEQYRHATYLPENYYLEALKRDENDIRNNNAYGLLMYRRGQFELAEKHFRKAISSLIKRNPNPYDSEAYYNLGLALIKLGKEEEAYSAFYKSTWNYAWQNPGYYEIACIDAKKGDYTTALEHIEQSLIRNVHNIKARNLKTALLRSLGKVDEAIRFNQETLGIDPLSFGALNEKTSLERTDDNVLMGHLATNVHNFLELALDYGTMGFYEEAIRILQLAIKEDNTTYPMIHYFTGYYYNQLGDVTSACRYYEIAAKDCPDYCFPHRLEEILVLNDAMKNNPEDAKAPYYLGNLYYDKLQFNVAMELWEKSLLLDDTFSTANRNLALAYVNKSKDEQTGVNYLEKAFETDSSDARVFFELDQLYKKMGRSYESRLNQLQKHSALVEKRDDIYVEYVTLLNMLGRYEEAKTAIDRRNFHPWEGGEGKVASQYKRCRIELAKQSILNQEYQEAIELLKDCKIYPIHLGEGKLTGTVENEINYFIGLSYERMNRTEDANNYFEWASVGMSEPTDAMFYNDQPADVLFYQGLSKRKLGDLRGAKRNFNKLVAYGELHLNDEKRIDYFAVSLPDFLVFDVDLNERNKVHCTYLMGLGHLGLENNNISKDFLEKAYMANNAHQGVWIYLNLNRKLWMELA